MDKLMEVIQGIEGTLSIKTVNVKVNTMNDDNISQELSKMIDLLELERDRSSSVNAIIDEMQAELQRLNYLFGFQ